MPHSVEDEIAVLVEHIKKLGAADPADGRIKVKFGVLFEGTADVLEALAGTLRAAKKRKIVAYEGELLLQGMSDGVDVVLL